MSKSKKPGPAPREQLNVLVSADLKRRFIRACHERGIKIQFFIENWIRNYLQDINFDRKDPL